MPSTPSATMPDSTPAFAPAATQDIVAKTNTALSLYQAQDALVAEFMMAALTHEAREQGLWSVATKQADANSARMAKQSEEWGRI